LTAVAPDFPPIAALDLLFCFPAFFIAGGLGAERRFRARTFTAFFFLIGDKVGFRTAVFFPGLVFFFVVGMRSSCPRLFPLSFTEI
jgi:hypothetical protein